MTSIPLFDATTTLTTRTTSTRGGAVATDTAERTRPSIVGTVLRHEVRNLPKNRGVLFFALTMMLISESVLRLTGSGARALTAMLDIVLVVVPLVTIVFGVISWHSSREFNELLLAQPVRRRSLFAALYLALVAPLATAVTIGLLTPFSVHGAVTSDALALLLATVGAGCALTLIFGGLALLIGVSVDDRLRGVALGLALWLLLTVAYDGLVLLVATTFADYSLERPMLALTLFNPVDLARALIVMQSDTAALMGYTGAVMHRFLGGALGSVASLLGLLGWIVLPALLARRAFERRDF